MKCRRRCCWLLLASGGILILAFAMRQQILPLLARWLDVGGPPQKADAVVLLNGGFNTRPFVAAALVHGGWAPKLLVNTMAAHPSQVSGAVPPSSTITLKVLAYGGVPLDRVVCLDSKVETTFDEAKAVAKYLDEHPAKRLLIVTEGPHSRRARWIFRRVLADRPVEIAMVSAPAEEFENENWWRSEAGVPLRRERVLQALLLRPALRLAGLRAGRRRGRADFPSCMVFAAAETKSGELRVPLFRLGVRKGDNRRVGFSPPPSEYKAKAG